MSTHQSSFSSCRRRHISLSVLAITAILTNIITPTMAFSGRNKRSHTKRSRTIKPFSSRRVFCLTLAGGAHTMFSGIVAHAAAEEHRNRVSPSPAPATAQQSSTSLNYRSFDDDDDGYCNNGTSTLKELEQQEIDRQDARSVLSNYHEDFPSPLFDRSVVSAAGSASAIVEEDDSLEDMKTTAKAFIPVATEIGIVAASTHTHLLIL